MKNYELKLYFCFGILVKLYFLFWNIGKTENEECEKGNGQWTMGNRQRWSKKYGMEDEEREMDNGYM